MRPTLRTGMTLTVILLLFLAFNLVWVGKIPDIRWDFSQGKTHTLSPQVRQLLASLESPMDLYFFNAHDAPERSYALKRYGKRIEDRLMEYEKAAKGMINLHLIDPMPFSEDAYKAKLFGLDNNGGFMGLIGTRAGYGAQRIESFSLDREPLLEYEISHLIYKLQHPERPVIGLLSGVAMGESSGRLLKQLQRHFNLVNLGAATDPVPEQVKTLMVVHPQALPEQAMYQIEQFVLKGGKLMAFIDPLSEQSSNTTSANNRLPDLLAAWGIQMPADKFLLDHRYAASPPPVNGKLTVQLPGRLTLPRQAMKTDDPSTWKLNTVTVSSSGALFRRQKGRTTLTPLLYSSGQSELRETKRLASAPEFDSAADEASSQAQRHVIAARIEGPAYSAFPDGIEGQPAGVQKAAQIHVVVVADTDLLTDQVNSPAPDSNTLFILNTLDNLSAGDVLTTIRPRAPAQRSPNRLDQMRDSAAHAYAQKATELEQRLLRTEQEWQMLRPTQITLGSQTVDTTTQLVALNKERLRLPMELHALRAEAYAQVHRLEFVIKMVVTLAIPLTLCLVAWVVFRCNRRRRLQAGVALY
ncbi:Gldg family protein [Pseudomonas sp. NIBRBAC000502773]|uniref:Gldg family protein n=1 Tax=Pseudomonas sp. NIBRBAC000502773 TaxID=2590776 RepID=UPI001131E380|nr:Gldg family protein [Pseudomonas sp. NIBRBAC000502773]QDG59445.1 ABC transporter [Pseudomonas sp. NIBRBAC000502773]